MSYTLPSIAENIFVTIIPIDEIIKQFHTDAGIDGGTFNNKTDNNLFLQKYFSEQEIHKLFSFKVPKRRKEWLAGRYAVKTLIKENYPDALPCKLTVEVKEGGSPFIKEEPDWHISISHSGEFVAAALSMDKNIRIGIDIEKTGPEKSASFKRIAFTDREIDYLALMPPEQLYKSWCIKEAYMKLIEKGMDISLKKIEYIDDCLYVDKKLINDINIHLSTLQQNYIFVLIYNSK